MHTPRVSHLSSPLTKPLAARLGAMASLALLTGALAGVAPLAHADDVNIFLGAGVGAVAGAAIGQSMGGRNGAILGAGAGGLVGASIANQGYAQQRPSPMPPAYAPNPHHATYYQQPVARYQPPVVAWQQPPPQVRYVQPINYYREPVVTWQPPPQEYRHWREERRHQRHHNHGHHYDRY